MDHGYIDQRDVIERYVMDRLSSAETAEFEEHYIACEECLDRLEAAEGVAAASGNGARPEWFRCRLIGVGPVIPGATRERARLQVVNPSAIVVPVFVLEADASASYQISATGRFVLHLKFTPDPRVKRFEARVADENCRVVSVSDGVPPPATGSLGLTLHSSAFRSGVYVVSIDGCTASSECVQQARFVFTFLGPDPHRRRAASIQ